MAFLTLLAPATSAELSGLNAALAQLEARLTAWAANSEAALALLSQVYGPAPSEAMAGLLADVSEGRLEVGLEILAATVLGDALGGYTTQAPEGGERIYLNAAWLAGASADAIEAVLLEELGHAFDRRLHGNADTPGDEGERFSALLRGVQPSAGSTQEDDQRLITIGDATVAIEAAVVNTAPRTPATYLPYIFRLTDSYGDGWNGARMEIRANGIAVATLGSTFTSGSSLNIPVNLTPGTTYSLFYTNSGSYSTEVGVQVIDPIGTTIYSLSAGRGTVNSTLFTWTGDLYPLTTLAEDTIYTTSVQALFGTYYSDLDGNSMGGVVVTGNSATGSQGTWQRYNSGTASWVNLATNLTDANGLFLAAATQLRFLPSENYFGTAGTLTVRLADSTTSLSDGTQADVSINGGSTPFSSGTVSRSLAFTPVDDPTTATNLSTPETYSEDTPLNLTDIVVSDIDSANVTVRLALSNLAAGSLSTGTAGSATSTFSSGAWTASGAITDVNTLLAGVTYTPSANYNGSLTIATSIYSADSNYNISSIAYTPKTFTGQAGPSGDDNSSTVALPFSFKFYENTYNTVYISTNGYITFTNTRTTDFSPVGPLPSSSADDPSNLIALAWEDLNAPAGSITYGTTGTGDNRTFVVQYNNVPHYGSGNLVSGQIQLYEATGEIEIHTGLMQSDGGSHVQGIENSSGTLAVAPPGRNYGNWSVSTPDAYRFTPPVVTTGTKALTGIAVNDAPVATGSASLAAINEDNTTAAGATVASLFTANFSDATDAVSGGSSANTLAGIAIIAYSPDATKGTWQYSSNGSSWSTLNPVAAASSAFTLKASDLLRFVPAANWNGSAPTLAAKLIDSSTSVTTAATVDATGGGTTAYSTAAVTLSHTVNPVNDAPVAIDSASLAAIAEDNTTAAGATVASLFAANFSDAADAVSGGSAANTFAGIAITSYTPDATTGTWEYATDGTSWSTLNAVAVESSAFTLTPSDWLRFVPAANFNGAAPTLSAKLIESPTSVTTAATVDATGGGSTAYSAAVVTLSHTVNPVNDAPVNTLPAAQTVDEDTDLAISGLSIADVDAGSAAVTVTLAVSSGTLTVAAANAVSISNSGSASVTLSGSVAAINAALAATNGVVYRGNSNFNGSDTLTISTDDAGNSGSGGSLTDLDSVAITVNPVNDAPVNTLPAAQTVDEDTDLAISGLSIADVDAGSAAVTVTLAVSSGTLTVAAANAVSISNSGSASVTLSGSVAAINAALAATNGVVYRGNLNFNGSDTLTITSDDGGNSGSGGSLTDLDSVAITVSPVNDAPVVVAAPASSSVQWSDPITPILFTATDVDDLATDLAQVSIAYRQPGSATYSTGLPTGFSINPGTTPGTWLLSGTPLSDTTLPGSYSFRLTVRDDDTPTPAEGSGLASLAIAPEDAVVRYQGQNWVGTSGTSGTVLLQSSISELADLSPAFFTALAQNSNENDLIVRYVDRENGNLLLASSLSTEATNGVARITLAVQGSQVIASTSLTINLGNADAVHRVVGTVVEGYVARNSPFDDTIITVAKTGSELLNGATGDMDGLSGLTIGGQNTTGSLDAAFALKLNKTSKNLQGSLIAEFSSSIDPLTGSPLATPGIYRVKASAWDSAGLTKGSGSNPEAVSLIAKGNLSNVTNPAAPIALGGNFNLQASFKDYDIASSSSATPDQISFRLLSTSNLTVFDTMGYRNIASGGEILI